MDESKQLTQWTNKACQTLTLRPQPDEKLGKGNLSFLTRSLHSHNKCSLSEVNPATAGQEMCVLVSVG